MKKLFQILIIASVLVAPIYLIHCETSKAIIVDEWKKVMDADEVKSAFVFYLGIHTRLDLEYLEEYEYLNGDVIDYCTISILERKPDDLKITPKEIIFTSPSQKKYNMSFNESDEDLYYAGQYMGSLVESIAYLNESGIWSLDIIFNESRSYPLIFQGISIDNFSDSSGIHIFYNLKMNVFTNLEYQLLRAAKALEDSAKASEDSAKALEDSIFWSKVTTGALIAAAGIAFISILVQILLSTKKSKEEEKERNRHEKTRVRKIKADCKHRMDEPFLEIAILIRDFLKFLQNIEKNNYQHNEYTLKYYGEFEIKFNELAKKCLIEDIYVHTFKEAETLHKEIAPITGKIVGFTTGLLPLLSIPTENYVKSTIINLKNIQKLIERFHSFTV
jgi:hypothetical protein